MAYNTFLTTAGIGLLNASTEANPVVFVKGVFGDGVLVKNLSIVSLVNEIYSTTDLITGPVMDDTYYCRFVLPAGTFLTDKTIKEVGLYAKLQGQSDAQAILFSACIYPSTLISPITDGAAKSLLVNYQFKTSNTDANIFISDSVSNVTEDELYQVLTAYAEKTYVDDEITALKNDLLNQNLLDTSVIDFVLGEDIGSANTEGMTVKICCDDAGNPVIKKLIDYISEPGVFLTDLGYMYPVTALAVSTTYIHSIKIKRLNNIDFCVIAYSPVVNSNSGSAAKGLYLAVFEIKSLSENDAIKLSYRTHTNIHTITYDSTKPDEIVNAMMRYSNINLDIFSEDATSLRFVLFFDDTIHPAPVLNTDTYPNIIPEENLYTSNWNCSVGYLQLMEGNDEFSGVITTTLSTSSELPRSCRYAYDESYNTYLCAIETHGYVDTFATQYRLKSVSAIQPIKFDVNGLPYIFGLTPTFVNPIEDLAEPDNDVFGIISDFLYTKNHTFAFTYVRTVSDDRMDLDVRSYDRWNNFRIDTKYDALINKKMSNRIAYCTVSDTGVVTIEYTNEIMLGKRVFNADLKKIDNDMVLLSFYGTTDDDYTKYSTTDGNNTVYPVNMYFQLYEVLSTGRLSAISSSLKSIETFNKNLLSYANNDKLYNKKLYKLTEAGHIRSNLLTIDIFQPDPYKMSFYNNNILVEPRDGQTGSATPPYLTEWERWEYYNDRINVTSNNWIKFDGSELQRVLYFQYDGSSRFIIKKDNSSGTIVGYTTNATGGNITTNNGSGSIIGNIGIIGGTTSFTIIQGYGIKLFSRDPWMDGASEYDSTNKYGFYTPILENIYINKGTVIGFQGYDNDNGFRSLFLPERNLVYHYLYNVQNAGLLPFRMNSAKLNKKKSITNGWMYDIEINFDYDFLEYENEYTDSCRKVLNTVNYTYNYKISKVLNGSTVYTSELNQIGIIDYKKEISIINNRFIKTPDNALYNKVADENLDKFAGRIIDCKKYHFIKNELFELNGINVNLITQPFGEFSMVKKPVANDLLPFLWNGSAILKLSQYIPYPLSVLSMMSYQFFNYKDADNYIGVLLESGVKSETKPVRISGKVSVLFKEQFAFTSVLAPASDIYSSKNAKYNKLSTIVSNNRIGLLLREVEPGDETKGYYCLMFNDINKFNMTEFYNKLLNN